MTETDIHKCLISSGIYPMTSILEELEKQNRFEECGLILKAMKTYRERFKIVPDYIPMRHSEKFKKEYYSYFKGAEKSLIENSLNYHIKNIKDRLKL